MTSSEVRREMSERNLMPVGQKAHQRLLAIRPIGDQAANLDTVACRDDEAFVDVLTQRHQRLANRLSAKSQPLAHHNRTISLVGSNDYKLHVHIPFGEAGG